MQVGDERWRRARGRQQPIRRERELRTLARVLRRYEAAVVGAFGCSANVVTDIGRAREWAMRAGARLGARGLRVVGGGVPVVLV